jgi:hypothetical protein
MGTPYDAVVLAIGTVLAIHLAVQMRTRRTEDTARRPEAATTRTDTGDGEPYPTGCRWI